MKAMIFATALLAVYGCVEALPKIQETPNDLEARGLLEDAINNTLNSVLDTLGDTIAIDALDLNFDDFDSEYISGGLTVKSLKVVGIKSLVAKAISLNIFTQALTLDLDLAEIIVTFEYSADIVVLNLIPLYGEGRMTLIFDDVDLPVASKADLSDGISLKDTSVSIHLGKSTFDLNGLINNPEFSALVSNALNDNFSDFVNDNAELISTIISPIVETVINTVLSGGNTVETQKDLA